MPGKQCVSGLVGERGRIRVELPSGSLVVVVWGALRLGSSFP